MVYTPDGRSIFGGPKVANVFILDGVLVSVKDLPRPALPSAPTTVVANAPRSWSMMCPARTHHCLSDELITAHVPTESEEWLRNQILGG
jgi:hypothetical protein